MDILLVEDDPLIAMSTCEKLRSDGNVVIGPFSSADTAVVAAQEVHVDIALLDISIEGAKDGVRLARELKHLYGISSVFMSGEAATAGRNRDAAMGYLAKPYSDQSLSQLVDVVRYLLAGKMPPPPPLPTGFAVYHVA